VSFSNLFFFDEIPQKRLKNAIKVFAPIENDETVICLFDETLFGTGKVGFLLTDKRLYIKCIMEKPQSADVADIFELKHNIGLVNSQLVVKSGFKTYTLEISQTSGAKSKEVLFDILDRIVKLLRGEDIPAQIPVNCPNCGAPGDLKQSVCRFCRTNLG
jgi:hypothetical protein